MTATREALFALFDALGIKTVTRTHAPVFTVAESRALHGRMPGGHTKNLFLKDRKGRLFLVVARDDTEIDLKRLPARLGCGRLSFGRAELLRERLGVEPGSVTPFAVINDTAGAVEVVLDAGLMQLDRLNFHPLRNDATTAIARADLIRFLAARGHAPRILPLGNAAGAGPSAAGDGL